MKIKIIPFKKHTHLLDAARLLSQAAMVENLITVGEFNGVTLYAEPFVTTSEDVLKQYWNGNISTENVVTLGQKLHDIFKATHDLSWDKLPEEARNNWNYRAEALLTFIKENINIKYYEQKS